MRWGHSFTACPHDTREACMMKNRILVIEDDTDISNLICMNLEAAGYETQPVYDGGEAERLLVSGCDFDLALLDLMLPVRDGFSLIEPLKKCGIPAICLTAKDDVMSKVRGLKAGAEDYLVKPFEILELLVRMEKVLERTGKQRKILKSGGLTVDLARRKVWENGVEIYLRPTEFQLLTVFLQNRNIILRRDKLLDLVWGTDFPGETRTVDVHVAKLRKKLSACQAIKTIPKGGYLFEDDGL